MERNFSTYALASAPERISGSDTISRKRYTSTVVVNVRRFGIGNSVATMNELTCIFFHVNTRNTNGLVSPFTSMSRSDHSNQIGKSYIEMFDSFRQIQDGSSFYGQILLKFRISQFNAKPTLMANSTTCLFNTGIAPGKPGILGHTCVF